MNIVTPWLAEPPKREPLLKGWQSHEEEFARVFKTLPAFPNMIEIGSFYGKTAHHLLSTYSGLALYCIDPWKPYDELKKYDMEIAFETWQVNLWQFRDRVHAIRMNSIAGMYLFTHDVRVHVDIVYIDGAHDFLSVLEDITVACLCFPNALICGDDYLMPEVKRAVHVHANLRRKLVYVGANKKYWEFQNEY